MTATRNCRSPVPIFSASGKPACQVPTTMPARRWVRRRRSSRNNGKCARAPTITWAASGPMPMAPRPAARAMATRRTALPVFLPPAGPWAGSRREPSRLDVPDGRSGLRRAFRPGGGNPCARNQGPDSGCRVPAPDRSGPTSASPERHTGAATLKLELQKEAWKNIGPVRTAEKLDRMDKLIAECTARLDEVAIPAYGMWNQSFIEFEELRNLLDCAKAVTRRGTGARRQPGRSCALRQEEHLRLFTALLLRWRPSQRRWLAGSPSRTGTHPDETPDLLQNPGHQAENAVEMAAHVAQGREGQKAAGTLSGNHGQGRGGKVSAPAMSTGSAEAAIGESTRV